MKRKTMYDNVRFSADVLREAFRIFMAQLDPGGTAPLSSASGAEVGNLTLDLDSVEEFFEEYGRGSHAHLLAEPLTDHQGRMRVIAVPGSGSGFTSVEVEAPYRSQIDAVFEILDNHVHQSVMLKVFIGHGRSQAWRELEEHVRNRHRCRIEPYEIGSRAGHAIRDILEVEEAEEGCAILVVTGEDVALNPSSALRLDLAHEAGVLQGRLGFDNVMILAEQGSQSLSGMRRLRQIRFRKDSMRETFGLVSAALDGTMFF